jgi:hypothetical protein
MSFDGTLLSQEQQVDLLESLDVDVKDAVGSHLGQN